MTTNINCVLCHRSFDPSLFPITPTRHFQTTCYSCLASGNTPHDLPVQFDCSSLDLFYAQLEHFQKAIKALGLIMASKNDQNLPHIKQTYEITGIDNNIFEENNEIREEFCSRVVANIRNVYAFHKTGKAARSKKMHRLSFRYTCHRTNRIRKLKTHAVSRQNGDKPAPSTMYSNIQGSMLSPDDEVCKGTLNIHFNFETKTVSIAHTHTNHEYSELPRLSPEDEKEITRIFEEGNLTGPTSAGRLFSLGRFAHCTRSQISHAWNRLLIKNSGFDSNQIT